MRTNRLSPTSGFPCQCCQNHSTMVTCSGLVREVLPLYFRTQSSDRELTVTLSHNMLTIDEVTFKGSRGLYPASTLFNEPKTKITASNGQGSWENDTKQSLQSATLKYKVRQRQTVNWFFKSRFVPQIIAFHRGFIPGVYPRVLHRRMTILSLGSPASAPRFMPSLAFGSLPHQTL